MQADVGTIANPADIPGVLDAEALRHLLEVELARSRRYRHPFALLQLAVDDGEAGEDARSRRTLAGVLRLHMRWADSVGFDEEGSLIVILRDTTAAGARAAADKLRASFEVDLADAGVLDKLLIRVAAWRQGDDLPRLLQRLR